MDTIEKRARELLAAEYEREPLRNSDMAKQIRRGVTHNTTWHALAALRAALTPPDGFALVPVEPTEEMYAAAAERVKKNTVGWGDGTLVRDPVAHAWIAMLDARPEMPNVND